MATVVERYVGGGQAWLETAAEGWRKCLGGEEIVGESAGGCQGRAPRRNGQTPQRACLIARH